jgi:hypothetical protein
MAIEQNLGRTERTIRLVLGAMLAAWVLLQPEHSALHWVLLVAGVFLVLNGVFGRCYLWRVLRLDRSGRCDSACGPGASDH